MQDLLLDVLETVAHPEIVVDDPTPLRRRFHGRDIGPSRWLRVVVSYEQEPARIVTAFPNRKDPETWSI